uniref:Kaptin actin binding protein n=1 Tax=Amblyomma sculptum TaxID=1581419 RepID=A0A1E1XLJ2_AMBSC
MNEAHFSGLPSQSNIYGMTTLNIGDANKVLVSCLQRNVFCIEYTRNKKNVLTPSSREIHFTYLPEGADVIAIDAFSKSVPDNLDIIIGIAFIRPGENQLARHYLNIYSQSEPGCGLDLDRIAQGCQSLELNFIPYQLTHALLFPNQCGQRNGEFVFLLCGSDSRIHLFREDIHQTYSEIPVQSYFPEFANIPDIVLAMDLKYKEGNGSRISAIGCESGFLQVAVTAQKNRGEIEIVSSWQVDLDSPISGLHLFEDGTIWPLPDFVKNTELSRCYESKGLARKTHLLVCRALVPSFVYRDVLERGLDQYAMLPRSDDFDSVVCGCVADIDMDGVNEVILGTYGQEVLVYKLERHSAGRESYELLWYQMVSHPILSIEYMDLTGDGVCELLVLSTKGLHILQHDLRETTSICIERMEKIAGLLRASPSKRD